MINQNTPVLRFKEFNDVWEEKRLGDIAEFYKGKGISKKDIIDNGKVECIRYGELYTDYNENIIITVSKTNQTKNLFFSKYNDVIMPSSGETQLDIAKASCVLKDNIALGGDLNVIRGCFNGSFIAYGLTNIYNLKIAEMAQGNSVVHLYAKELKQLKFMLPSIIEQTKIANFLSAVDEKLQIIQTKKQLLEQYKKGMMQRIFNREIRFKDDNEQNYPDWEEKRLGDVLKEPLKNKVINPNVIELLTVQLHFKGVKRSGKFPKSTEKGRPYYIRNAGELIIGRQNLHNGGIAIVNKETSGCIASNAISSLSVINANSVFMLHYMSTLKFMFFINNLIGGTGQKEISIKELLKIRAILPSIPEQTKIANLLSSIDDKITIISEQIEEMKKFKKSLMQRMFV